MEKILFICCCFLHLFGQALNASPQRDYALILETALDQIVSSSIRNFDEKPFDWHSYREMAFQKVQDVKNDEDFFALMQRLLSSLEDSHSYYVTPVQQYYLQNDDEHARPLPTVVVDNHVGVITMPHHAIDVEALKNEDKEMLYSLDWVKTFHRTLVCAKSEVTRGWVIDLTENYGGAFAPMMGALCPFFVKSYVGGVYYRDTTGVLIKQKTFFDRGRLFFEENGNISDEGFQYPIIPHFEKNDLPVVVLIGPNTESSGELLALALSFQPNTILIGKPTFGVANANGFCQMPDTLGCFMVCCGYLLDQDENPLYSMKVYPRIHIDSDRKELVKEAYSILQTLHRPASITGCK